MVVVGAGASYDSVHFRPIEEFTIHSYPFRPPLANQLFDDRPYFGQAIDDFPQCRPLAQRLRRLAGGVSLEQELDSLFSEAADYAPLRRQFTALRFYLQRVLFTCGTEWLKQANKVTNYVGLLDTIDRWRTKRKMDVCFVSFNYDLMLEAAFDEIGVTFSAFADYLKGPYYLIKPHGSVDWARRVHHIKSEPQKSIETMLIEQIDNITITREFVHMGASPSSGSTAQPLFPAIAVPLAKKLDFEVPESHLEALKAMVPQVTHLLTIGWRGTEESFLKLFQENRRPKGHFGLVVSGSREGAQEVGTNMTRFGLTPAALSGHTFSSFVRSDEFVKFLAQS
jgi:hypothetical protein